jgi:virginiamycin B lyase
MATALACGLLLLGTPGTAVAQTGTITEFPVPTSPGSPGDIKVGPDGGMWFTEFSGNKVGR